ncbi:MAG: alpha/beta hydrolase [Candidatus Pacebacteria bacterium]|nr:alpha/beta hydrolase [Candidatus Paceibacterota bacterium]
MKTQIILIHGGEVFNSYKQYLTYLKRYKLDLKRFKTKGWKSVFPKKLGNKYEVIAPQMPSPINAKYAEWKIYFNKFKPFLKNNLILIGHSLGGIFLAKYLSKNKLSKKIKATFLIAAPYDDKKSKYSLGDFRLPKNLNKFQNQGGQIFLFQSQDDPVVPFADVKKYQKSLPLARAVIFKNKKHFNQPQFPELIKIIKNVTIKT